MFVISTSLLEASVATVISVISKSNYEINSPSLIIDNCPNYDL